MADAGQGQDSRLTRARLERLVADVLRLPGENRPSWGLRVLTVMMEVSGDATRPEPRPSLQPVAVGKALRFIEEHLHQPLTVPEVANFAGVSRRTLERAFTAAGLGAVSHHIIAQRVDRAEHMLLDTKLSAKEIAFACGFGGAKRMIYDFHRLRGLTPSQVRQGES